jgi:hypothetical protein
MHPELSWRLTLRQVEEAKSLPGLFSGGVELVEVTYPLVYVRLPNIKGEERLVEFDATNYDFQAMRVRPVDPQSRAALTDSDWVRRDGTDFPRHPELNKEQFFCIWGVRDYYTYPGHNPALNAAEVPWEFLRNEYRFADLLSHIVNHFRTGKWQ